MNKRTPRKLICVALALIMTLSLLPMSAFAAGEVAIDETNFPDPVFRQYVLDNCDTDKNSTLSSEEISNVTEIDVYVACGGPNGVSEPQIRSLDGIVFFTALTGLDCTGNLLTSLDVSKNTALISLSCTHNQLTSLDVSKNPALSSLDCSSNSLSTLDVSKSPFLTLLFCDGNQLTSLDVGKNTNLESLCCSGNQLSELDISNNAALTGLDCNGNSLSALDVSSLSNLSLLWCSRNNLTSLNLSNKSQTIWLECYDNQYIINQRKDFDYTTLPGKFEVTKVSNVQGGKFDTAKHTFTFDDGVTEATYDYATGNDKCPSVTFTLNYDENAAPESKPTEPTDKPTEPTDKPTDPTDKPTEPVQPPHTHSYGAWVVVKEPTSAQEGEEKRTCSCGAVETRAIPKLTSSFTDVPADQYYYEPVQWAVKNGITSGVSKDKFGPHNPCTRGQIVTFLWAAAGRPEPTSTTNPFRDVSSKDYFYKAVLWAVENKITAGASPDRFAPHQTCTRAQTVTFLWASQGRPASSTKVQFTDVSAKDYFADSVAWAYENGVTAGVGGGRFGSGNNCTRAHCVTFLYKSVH